MVLVNSNRHKAEWVGGRNWFPAGALTLILLLAFFLRFYHLADSSSNFYYAATVKSMLTSWHNFFYVAYEPAGSVTVDKPPLGFWLQAISAYFLGLNSFALAFPQAFAGFLGVGVMYGLVKRSFGVPAGLLAALVLATTPVTVSTERNNTIDGTLVFVLLLATWAVMRAVESGRVRHLLLMAFLVGLGFNIKMLQAFLPLPAFYGYYFVAGPGKWWQRMGQLGLATILLVMVSLSWAVAVDLTPAGQRPYIGSSTNNTVMQLIVGHNGLNRLLSLGRRGPVNPPANGPADNPAGNAAPTPPTNGEIGQPGPWRLLVEPLVSEAGWLLPLAGLLLLLGGSLILYQVPNSDPRWPLWLLWGGWLMTEVIFFNVANLFHAYYLIMLGPPMAAIVGIGGLMVWQLLSHRPGVGWLFLLLTAGLGVGFQVKTLLDYPTHGNWLVPLMVGLATIGLLALWLWLWGQSRPGWVATAGITLIWLAMLLPPVTWSMLTALNPSPDVMLPRSGPGRVSVRPGNGLGNLTPQQQAILDYLNPRTQNNRYLLATLSSMDASPFLLASDRAVLTFGGFSGGDPVINTDQLAQLVANGDLAYILDTGLPQRKPELYNWVKNHCTLISVPGLDLQNLPSQPNLGGVPAGGPPTFNLYHCE